MIQYTVCNLVWYASFLIVLLLSGVCIWHRRIMSTGSMWPKICIGASGIMAAVLVALSIYMLRQTWIEESAKSYMRRAMSQYYERRSGPLAELKSDDAADSFRETLRSLSHAELSKVDLEYVSGVRDWYLMRATIDEEDWGISLTDWPDLLGVWPPVHWRIDGMALEVT